MLRIDGIVGHEEDANLSSALHRLQHHGAIEHAFVPEEDAGRRRLRLTTDRGTQCGVSLARHEELEDGAVLYIDENRAIILRVRTPKVLRLRPKSRESALHLGWNAGNLHWRVKFEGDDLLVMLDGTREDYLARLTDLIANGSVEVDDAPHR